MTTHAKKITWEAPTSKSGYTWALVLLLVFTGLYAALPEHASCQSNGQSIQSIGDDSDVAITWRGLQHTFDREVHRTGKFGNWVELANSAFPKVISTHHLARTGTSKDNATFAVVYDLVQATKTRFVAGVEKIAIQVREREMRTFSHHISIPVSSDLRLVGKTSFATLINGFALMTAKDALAKKLGTLEVTISTPVLSLQNIEFDISGKVFMSCASTECDYDELLGDQEVDYSLHVRYLLVASADGWMHRVQHAAVTRDYDYQSGSKVPEALGAVNSAALGPGLPSGYQTYAFGFNHFMFNVVVYSNSADNSIAPKIG
jgi:hypothetical protein